MDTEDRQFLIAAWAIVLLVYAVEIATSLSTVLD